MNFDSNNFNFHPDQISEIEHCLINDGYVRIQFSPEHFPTNGDPTENLEKFFIKMIEKLGGECLAHNNEMNSFVWHVQPIEKHFNEQLARSQTDDEFPFHTDCSYEINPPQYMALFVLEEDQFGGGELEIIRLADILKCLSSKTKERLRKEKFRIEIPIEFRKSSEIDHINAPILFDEEKIRYRSDILSEEFKELNSIIQKVEKYRPKLSKYSMIILNNQKYLHGRTKILDHRRHLLRIRFNRPMPVNIFSIYDKDKFSSEYLTFNNDFYDYLDNQHEILFQILCLIIKEYNQTTSLGEQIRQTFQFNERIHWILTQSNIHRPNFQLGTYRPDVLFHRGSLFQINGKYSFEPKICEINARFPFNGYFLSAALCSTDQQNRYSKRFARLIETIIQQSNFDPTKRMFILKGKEDGYDIHLFKEYWQNKSSEECLFVNPRELKIENHQLINTNNNYPIEQCVLELHQDEILDLPNEILEYFIENKQLNYFNDFRTIFILHDKRLFALLSNEAFLYALSHQQIQLIPTTYVVNQIPNYLKDAILKTKEHWIIKPNAAGKGENIIIGADLTSDQWSCQLFDSNHKKWIVQEYLECIQYQSMNLSGMLFCLNNQCFNLGVIRMSSNKIVNLSHGGSYIRPYVHQQSIHSTPDQSILTKEKLHKQLIQFKSLDHQWNHNVYISSSGGSGGKRLFFITDIQQNQLQRQILVNMMLDEEIILHNDVCLNLFQSNNIYRSFEIFNDFCSMANCTTIPMSSNTRDEDILEIIEYFQPNILMGSPYRLMQLAIYLEKQSKMNVHFERIYFACEALDQIKKNEFKRMFHCNIFIGFYGSAETGVFACQSPKYSSTKIYLYPKGLVEIEIIDSRIIVTNLIRKRNQLIRFDTGDLGRILPSDKYGLLEVFHSERLIMIGNDTLSKSDIEEIMKPIEVIEWQLIIDYISDMKTRFLFRYVKSEREISEENIRKNLQKYFVDSLTNFSEKLIIQFESIAFDQLIRDKTSNKLLKILDQRS